MTLALHSRVWVLQVPSAASRLAMPKDSVRAVLRKTEPQSEGILLRAEIIERVHPSRLFAAPGMWSVSCSESPVLAKVVARFTQLTK
jgi:hypothetical protein